MRVRGIGGIDVPKVGQAGSTLSLRTDADRFESSQDPSAGRARAGIAGLHTGTDLDDLRTLLIAIGYDGNDPIGDHVLQLVASGFATVRPIGPDDTGSRAGAANPVRQMGASPGDLAPSAVLHVSIA